MISIEEIIILSLLKLSIVGIREEVALKYDFKESDEITIITKDNSIEIKLKENGNYVRKEGNEIKARPYFPFRRELSKIKRGEYSRLSKAFKSYCLTNSGVNRNMLRSIFYPQREDVIEQIIRKMPNLSKDRKREEAEITYKEMSENNHSFQLFKPLIRNA